MGSPVPFGIPGCICLLFLLLAVLYASAKPFKLVMLWLSLIQAPGVESTSASGHGSSSSGGVTTSAGRGAAASAGASSSVANGAGVDRVGKDGQVASPGKATKSKPAKSAKITEESVYESAESVLKRRDDRTSANHVELLEAFSPPRDAYGAVIPQGVTNSQGQGTTLPRVARSKSPQNRARSRSSTLPRSGSRSISRGSGSPRVSQVRPSHARSHSPSHRSRSRSGSNVHHRSSGRARGSPRSRRSVHHSSHRRRARHGGRRRGRSRSPSSSRSRSRSPQRHRRRQRSQSRRSYPSRSRSPRHRASSSGRHRSRGFSREESYHPPITVVQDPAIAKLAENQDKLLNFLISQASKGLAVDSSATGGGPSKDSASATTYEKGEPPKIRADLLDSAIAAEHSILISPKVTLPDSVLAKIKADDYVDFGDILTKGPKTFNVTAPTLTVGQDSKIEYVELPKGPLSMVQWNLAFDRYADAYIDQFPSAAPGLRRYGMLIRSLMLTPTGLWAQYDEAFRQKRKALNLPFCSFDQGFLALQRLLPQQGLGASGKLSKSSNGTHVAKKPSILGRVCFDFNDGRCNRDFCRYRHVCERCRKPHARAECDNKPQGGRGRGGRGAKRPSVADRLE